MTRRVLLRSPDFIQDKRNSLFFFVFLPFLGPLLRHMEVPRLRGPIGAIAAGLYQSHSNVGSEPHPQPTPQLTATPDP